MVDKQSIEPACHVAAPRRVDAGQGAIWWRDSIELLSVDTEHWIVATLLMMVVGAALSYAASWLPYAGDLLIGLLMPVFSVGMLYLAYRVLHGHTLVYRDVFIGLRCRTRSLVLAGAAQVALQVIVYVMAFVMLGLWSSSLTLTDFRIPPEDVEVTGISGVLVFLFSMIGGCLYLCAAWFQPALVFFGERGPVQALKESLRAILVNWRAFMLYGLISLGLVFAFFAAFALAFMLVKLWLSGIAALLIYLLVCIAALATALFGMALIGLTTYMAFRDIFGLESQTGQFL